jgi:protein-disulfide isomerase
MPSSNMHERQMTILATLFLCAPVLAAAGDGVPIATIGKESISPQDLTARTSAKLSEQQETYESQARQLKLKHERERHAYVEHELQELVDERVLALEASQKKTMPAALTASVKTVEITDTDLHRFYDSNKNQMDQPFDAIAPKLKEYLQQQAKDGAQRRYLDSLRIKYKAVVTLEPLREQVEAIGPQRGLPAAPVTIVEFSDFQCPFCGRFAPTIHGVLEKYPTQVRLVYRHLPIASLHPNAQKAAEAAVCAQDQGKFWEMHDLLFAEQSTLEIDALKEKAKRTGLDTKSFNECLDSGKSREAVRADVEAGNILGIGGTPTSFVNGRYVNGAVTADALSAVIDDELRRVTSPDHKSLTGGAIPFK